MTGALTESVLAECSGLLVKGGQPVAHEFRVVSHARDPKHFALFVYQKTLVGSFVQSVSAFAGKAKSAAVAAAKAATAEGSSAGAGAAAGAGAGAAELVSIPELCVALTGDVQVSKGRAGMWSLRYKAAGNRKATEWHVSGCSAPDFVDKLQLAQEITKSTGAQLRVRGFSEFDWLWKFRPVLFAGQRRTQDEAADETPADTQSSERQAFRTFELLVLTWNVAGKTPPTAETSEASGVAEELRGVLGRAPGVELAAVCLQETCELNAQNALVLASENGALWTEFFAAQVFESDWEVVLTETLVGMTLVVFGRVREHRLKLSEICTSRLKTGFSGFVGNKGAVSVRLAVESRMTLALANVHFSSGDGMEETRKKELDRLVTATEFGEEGEAGGLLENDVVIVTGDLNSRTTAEQGDELKIWMNDNPEGFLFSEASFDFPPTYKLVVGKEGVYDQHRRPGWCDRVLFRDNEGAKLNVLRYDSLPKVVYSDHTPVFMLAEIDILHPRDFFEKRRSLDL